LAQTDTRWNDERQSIKLMAHLKGGGLVNDVNRLLPETNVSAEEAKQLKSVVYCNHELKCIVRLGKEQMSDEP
jgi:phosphoribosylaminoimidazole (AIR) synthetase